MLGRITLYHLINDSLMPELLVYQDLKLFRKLWRSIQESLTAPTPRFINPSKAFERLGLPLHKEVKEEWWRLSVHPLPSSVFSPLKQLNHYYPQQHKTRFFTFLFWQNIHISYENMRLRLEKESMNMQKQYLLMYFMTHLEQYMEDHAKKEEEGKEIQAVFQFLMAFYWLKGYQDFPSLLVTKSLRYFKEELLYLFQNPEANTFFAYLAEQISPSETKAEKEILKEERSLSLTEMAQTIHKEMKEIKEKVIKIKTGEVDEQVYLTPKACSKILNISVQTLSNWRRKGMLKDYKRVANRYEYSKKEILALERSLQKKA